MSQSIKRCGTWLKNQKKHKYDRINFACMHVIMEQNFGKEKSSLFHQMGGMTYDAKNLLKNLDKESVRVAKRRYELNETGVRQNRKKRCYKARGEGAYSPGGEHVSAYSPGGEDISDEDM